MKKEKGKFRKWAIAALLLWCLCEVSAASGDMVEKLMKAMDKPHDAFDGWLSWWDEEEEHFRKSGTQRWDEKYDNAIKAFVKKALEKAPEGNTSIPHSYHAPSVSQHSWFKLLLVHHACHSSSSSSSLQMLILLRVPTDKGRDFCVDMLMEYIKRHIIFTEGHPIFFKCTYIGCKIFILVVDPHDKNRIPEFMRRHFKNHGIDVLSILHTKATDVAPASPLIIL